MATEITYRYGLDKGSKKFTCPQCRQKRFVRCIDFETGEYLPDHVGRCDREGDCGYEYNWSTWVKEVNPVQTPFIQVKPVEAPKPIEFLPLKFLETTVHRKYYGRNNLYLYLVSLFGERVALDLCAKYLIGTSAYWKGATIYWQIDEQERVRQCKIILYNPNTGKRVKEGANIQRYDQIKRLYVDEISDKPCSKVFGRYLDKSTQNLNLEQTFFGCHLLTEYPEKEVCIVESEKTAIIASAYLPQYLWLATGGASGCKWRDYATYKVLKDRCVTFFPDYGYFNKKTGKTCYQEWCERIERIKDVIPGKIRVGDVLEKRLAGIERQDQDFADLLIQRDEQTGFALNAVGCLIKNDYTVQYMEL